MSLCYVYVNHAYATAPPLALHNSEFYWVSRALHQSLCV